MPEDTTLCRHCLKRIYWSIVGTEWRHWIPTSGRSGIYCEPDMQSTVAAPKRQLDKQPQTCQTGPMTEDLATDNHLFRIVAGQNPTVNEYPFDITSNEREGAMLDAYAQVLGERERLAAALRATGVPAGLVEAIARDDS